MANRFFNLHNWCVAGLIAMACPLNAVEPPTTFDIVGGYRDDRITTKIIAHSEPGVILLKDKLKAKSVTMYQAGAKGQIGLCDYWFLKAYGYYSWGNHGRYHDKQTFPDLTTSESEANIHQSRARDFQIGGGYLYPVDGCWGCWGLGPVGGWAYNDQRIKINHATTDGFPDPLLDGLRYTTRWSGPWLGVDAVYRCCDFLVYGGFEYHWAYWHGSWDLDGPDVPGVVFSDRRRCRLGHGYVLYLDAEWEFCAGWHVGAGLKWQTWEARNGREHPKVGDFEDFGEALGLTSTEFDKVKNTRWMSLQATAVVGYGF